MIGEFVFTQYDPDLTRPFISEVSSNYGYSEGSKIIRAVYASLPAQQGGENGKNIASSYLSELMKI